MLKHMLNANGGIGCGGGGGGAVGNARTMGGGSRTSADTSLVTTTTAAVREQQLRAEQQHRYRTSGLNVNQSFDSHHSHISTAAAAHFPLLNLSAVSGPAALDASHERIHDSTLVKLQQQQQQHAIYAKPTHVLAKGGNGGHVLSPPTTALNAALMNGTAVNVNASAATRAPILVPHAVRAAFGANANAELKNMTVIHDPSSTTTANNHHHNHHAPNTTGHHHNHHHHQPRTTTTPAIKEMLISLVLLCLVSLLLALLALIFLLKISPVTASDIREVLRAEQLTVITAEEYVVVYEVTLALCALTLSLNLCCLLVCAIQFLFAVKLIESVQGGVERTNKYLQKASISRVCAVGGFFISIPVFLTAIILYTFIQFHSTPAILTSVFIGLGIVFCGCAMVHNVLIWQREKTNAVRDRTALANSVRDAREREQHGFRRSSFHNISAPIAAVSQGRLSNSCTCSCADGAALTNFLHSTMTGSPIHGGLTAAQPPPPPPPHHHHYHNNNNNNNNHSTVGAHSPGGGGAGAPLMMREAASSGAGSSVSPAAAASGPPAGVASAGALNGLDLSSVATTANSLHELSTLV